MPLNPGVAQDRAASSPSPDPTVVVLTDSSVIYFKPPYGTPHMLPGTPTTLVASNAGNIFLANGKTIHEYISRVYPGVKIVLPAAITQLQVATDGTLLAVAGTALYAYPKPYEHGHIVSSHLGNKKIKLFAAMKNGALYVIAGPTLYTTRRPFDALTLVTPNIVPLGDPGTFAIDRTTGWLYAHRSAFAYPYSAASPVWQAYGVSGACSTPRRGPPSAGGGIFVVNCVHGATWVFQPPQTVHVARLSWWDDYRLQTVGSNGVIYAQHYTTSGDESLVSNAAPFTNWSTIGTVSGTIRGILVP